MEAERIHKENPNSFMPHQIDNPANPQIHTETTALEIWDDMDGKIDVLVAGAGTGGTICGTARKLKELNQNIKIICVEPSGSAVLSGGKRGPHKLQGIGPGFIPDIVDVSLFDEIIKIDDEDAMNTSRSLARKEGLFLGISSGAATYAAIQISDKYKNKNIVVIAPDTGERYLNTELYNENIKTYLFHKRRKMSTEKIIVNYFNEELIPNKKAEWDNTTNLMDSNFKFSWDCKIDCFLEDAFDVTLDEYLSFEYFETINSIVEMINKELERKDGE